MARRVLCPAVGLVWIHARTSQLQDADSIAEDPSEFFTMIFGGEAFADWYGTLHDTFRQYRGLDRGS
jgi:hypothetical protein